MAIRSDIEARYQDQLLGIGFGLDVVQVMLRPTATAAAAEIMARYPIGVEIRVGFFPYPAPASPAAACQGLLPTIIDAGPLRADIVLPDAHLAHGFFTATVNVTNIGSKAVSVVSGQPVSIYLFDATGTTLVGASPAAVGGTGLEFTLAPGASRSIDAGGGTGSCDLALGYELPDGAYVARAAIEVDQSTGPAYIWSVPLPVTLTTP